MRKLIKVTKENIELGLAKDGEFCPVGLALKDAGLFRPWVTRSFIRGRPPLGSEKVVNMDTPENVTRFISRFDNHRPVKPFNFYIFT